MPDELNARVRSRPLRIAFLVQNDDDAQLALDGIFADCYGRWGGRFNLVVPCENGQIVSGYWPWLEDYDPDIVYSYVALSRADTLEIHERLGPSEYHYHFEREQEKRLDVAGFKPNLHVSPLSSLSTIFRFVRQGQRPWEGNPTKIIDCWYTEKPSRYLTDNLGTYHQSRGTGIYPADARPAATLLTIVDPHKQADRKFGIPGDLDAVPDENAALHEFAERRATALSILSAIGSTPRLETRSVRWGGSFNLVIGASVPDRILFWNARLLIPAWLDTDICCWRLELDQLKEPRFCAAIAKLLNTRNYVTPGGGQSHITVRSISHSTSDLSEAITLLRAQSLFGSLRSEKVASLVELVPTPNELEHAVEIQGFGTGPLWHSAWKHFIWSSPKARPPVCAPDHLSDVPPKHLFAQGNWALDFAFQLEGPTPRFAEENTWVLSRRWRMAGAFAIEHVARGINREVFLRTRSNRNGNLVTFVSVDTPVASISVPKPLEGLVYAFVTDGSWSSADGEHNEAWLTNKVVWMTPSNEARYLDGVLGMTGGLRSAADYLLHPFLREVFAKMGGTPTEETGKAMPTISRLVKRAKQAPKFDLGLEADRRVLASLVLKAAKEIKGRIEHTSFDKLRDDWASYRAAFWNANPMQEDGDPSIDWDEMEQNSLESCLKSMRRNKMMFQGHQWICERCHHRNWVDLDELSAQLSCEVCRQEVDAPVNLKWLFRPSEFLIESLRDHSVLSLVWVLSRLLDSARKSMLYVGPTWFRYNSESAEYDAEGDLLTIVDGQAVLCEVKSSWHFPRAELVKFTDLAKRLRPNRAILAVMEQGTSHVSALNEAKELLAVAGINFEVITPEKHSREDEPYLPSH